jgi:hypothetical protein
VSDDQGGSVTLGVSPRVDAVAGGLRLPELSLRRDLEIGPYQTAWAMLHRLRSVLIRPGRERLSGTVEADETFVGGEPGLAGERARGKKSLVGVAVELTEPRGYGRCRMAPLPDASAASLRAFLIDHVELDEFVFRFNRLAWRSRGLVFYRVLELAVGHAPVRYRDLNR